MRTFRLYKYSWATEDETVMEHENEQVVAEHAISVSYENDDSVGFYTYRLEQIENDEGTFKGFRYFNNGKEFTQQLKDAALAGLNELRNKN